MAPSEAGGLVTVLVPEVQVEVISAGGVRDYRRVIRAFYGGLRGATVEGANSVIEGILLKKYNESAKPDHVNY